MSDAPRPGLNRRAFIKTAGAAAAAATGPKALAAAADISTYDVAVIGGGFCGVSAARDCMNYGLKTVLLEARNRLGGRTFTAQFDGNATDLGGTWVHWTQPHVWAEITRYGLPLAETPGATAPTMIVRRRNGAIEQVDLARDWGDIEAAADVYMGASRELFPRPHAPFDSEDYARLGRISSQERLDGLTGLSGMNFDVVDGFMATLGANYHDQFSWLEIVRCYALAGHNLTDFNDSLARYRFRDGTAALINAMIEDARPEVRLGAVTQSVSQDGDGVVIRTEDGGTVRARAAICAVPLNVLNDIDWSPGLRPGKTAAARERHAGSCTKVHVKLDKDYGAVACLAPARDNPMTWLFTEHSGHGSTHMIGFGPSPEALDVNDTAAVQEAVRRFIPDARVVESMGYQWNHDPFARGTWCILRPGQWGDHLRDLQADQGRIFFASADWASGWRGFIDGAIEQGLAAAGRVQRMLAASSPQAAAAPSLRGTGAT